MNMIVTERATWKFGHTVAVDHLSISVPQGQVVGLLGRNGAGKTTLLRLLSGFYVPSAETVRIAGQDMALSPLGAKAHIGYLPEKSPVYPEMKVDEYLRFCCDLKAVRKVERSGHIAEVLAATGLDQVHHRRIGNLSQGYRQRVGLAQALIGTPEVLLLDEPLSGLDPTQAVAFRALLRSLAGRHTIVLSSHLLREVAETCDRVLIMHEGRIILDHKAPGEGGSSRQLRLLVQMDPCDLLSALRSLPSVIRTRAQPSETVGASEAWVEVKRDAPFEQELFTLLCGLQAPLLRLTPQEDDLETVFLRATGNPSTGGFL